VATALTLVTVALFVALLAAHASAWVRLCVALPAACAAIVWLQLRRNTCIAHAAAGTTEHEDFSATKVDAALAEASRRVARTILRDGLLFGLLAGLLGLGSAWVVS
jgi:hypothetical protein